jgi:DNA-binding MarR family transcriptional regulator
VSEGKQGSEPGRERGVGDAWERSADTGEGTMALTKRQRELLDFIESFIESYGYSPSFEEIARFFGYRSLATVHEHLANLERKGYIRKNYNESRSR